MSKLESLWVSGKTLVLGGYYLVTIFFCLACTSKLELFILVEGCYGGPCLYLDCLLFAEGCSSKCMDLAM